MEFLDWIVLSTTIFFIVIYGALKTKVIAKFGKGNYIYTGLSFFRELPEGVSGAYRLLANMIALDK